MGVSYAMLLLLTVIRYTVFGVFVLGALAALGSWLIRSKTVSPFTPLGRFLRSTTDPVMKPVEARVVRAGGNPVNAGWWLVIGIAVVGVVAIGLTGWILTTAQAASWSFSYGPRTAIAFIVVMVYRVLLLALILRVVASWLGMFAYAKWMRPAYWLTDWLVRPLQRVLPPVGMFDISPLVAWLVLWLGKTIVLMLLG